MSDQNIPKNHRVFIRRGPKRNMPLSAPSGEMLFCTDTHDLYIGTGDNVAHIGKMDTIYDGGDFLDQADIHAKYADGGEF